MCGWWEEGEGEGGNLLVVAVVGTVVVSIVAVVETGRGKNLLSEDVTSWRVVMNTI